MTSAAGSPGGPPGSASPPGGPRSGDIGAARALYREGRYGDAREAFLSAAANSGGNAARAEALVGAGSAALPLNDTSGAIDSLREAFDTAPGGSDVRVRAGYLLLKSLNDAGEGAEGVHVYERDPEFAAGSLLETYVRFEAARAYHGARNIGTASRLLDLVMTAATASDVLRERALLEERAIGREANDPVAIGKALDALIALNGSAQYRFERAQLSFDSGDTDGYAAQLRTLMSIAPASVWAYQALNELEAAGRAVDPGDAGLVLYRRGLYARAIEELTPAVAEAPDASALAFRAFYLGASYEDSGDAVEAIQAYDAAAGSGASSAYVHRAMYWAARVMEGQGDASGASARYVALALHGPLGEFSEEAAFRAGFVFFESGDMASALASWGLVGDRTSARLEYWRGRALSASGDRVAAEAAYRRAVALAPFELHGLEAARELGQGISLDVRYQSRDLGKVVDWDAIEAWLQGRIGGGPLTRQPTPACELMTVGLREAAAAEIRAADRVATPWGSFALLREAAGCGLTDVAAGLAVSLRVDAGVGSGEPPKDLLRLSYPVDFAATLSEEARKADVDPLFLASLVRQESFWDPQAGSTAGALGLTQVIPQTGAAIAEQLGVADFRAEDLFLPALSLEFGAYYLGGELRSYRSPLLALAAYNAGPGPAGRWASAGDTNPADVVERIDYVETKAYVTYIYEAYAHYLVAWGD